MKQIQVIVRAFKLDAVRTALENAKILRMTLIDVRRGGKEVSRQKQYRGRDYTEDVEEIKLEVVAEDDEVESVADAIMNTLRAGQLCDGEVAILPMERVFRVRVGKL
jgi:nitrogen regulatory protein PII